LSDHQRIACNFAQKNNQKAQDFMEKNPEDFPPKKQGTKRKR
jgi:hypothetical protein